MAKTTVAPRLARAAVPPPEKTIEQQGAAAALSRMTSSAATIPPDARIVEAHITKLESALASEQRVHQENVQALKDFHEQETSRVEAEHRKEIAAKDDSIARLTSENGRLTAKLEEVRIKNQNAQRELASVKPYAGLESL